MKALTVLLCTLISISIEAQLAGPDIEWQQCFGGTGEDQIRDFHMTADNGFILLGYTTSANGQVSNNHGGADVWVVKTDANGVLEWERSYGGSHNDNGTAIVSTNEGGYLILADTRSVDGDVSEPLDGIDIWLVKLDVNGNIEWERSYGGTWNDVGFALTADDDGNYYVIGRSNSTDGMVTENFGLSDIWLFKIDSNGLLLWERSMGGTGEDTGYSIDFFSNGDIGVATRVGLQISDLYIARYTASGDLVWGENYGGSYVDACNRIRIDSTDNIHIAGHSMSIDGDLYPNNGGAEVWHLILDEDGAVIASRLYGGGMNDNANDIILTDDGGFIFSGGAYSSDGDLTENFGDLDAWVVRLDQEGNILWQRVYGGSLMDRTNRVIRSGNTIILGGFTNSSNGDISGNHGDFDYWLVKLEHDPVGLLETTNMIDVNLYPNPTDGEVRLSGINFEESLTSIEVLDAAGRSIMNLHPKSLVAERKDIVIDLKDLPSGQYQVLFRSPLSIYRSSIIKH